MNTLYLTAAEQKIFQGFQASKQEGWQVEREKLQYADSDDKRRMRFELTRFRDPKLTSLRAKFSRGQSFEDVASIVDELKLTNIDDQSFLDLLFALGPEIVGLCIAHMLSNAPSDDDIERVAALSHLRHSMLESLQPVQ